MRNLTIGLGLLIFALAGFYGGARYESGKAVATTGAAASAAGATGLTGNAAGRSPGTTGGTGSTAGGAGTAAGGFAGAGGLGRGTFGQITAISGSTLTIQDAQGNQIKVVLQPSTTIVKTVAGAQSDLANGVNVTVGGQRASDGSVTATTITIVPAGATGSRG